MTTVSGMASRIRGCNDSETFDLAGQNEATITHTISQAFSEPFPLSEMIRLTFIVGAGKLGRQKYDENAAKAVTSALRTLNFQEDHGASCVIECAGTYKLQHDTGKNLKTVVVFPKVLVTKPASTEPSAVAFDKLSLGNEQQQSSSPEQICALSSQVVFTNMLQSKCPSWSQKKGCLTVLSEILERIQTYEHKLLKGEPLSDTEQEWYDAVSLEDIAKKEALVKKEMAAHVEAGRITAREKDMLVVQVAERIEKLEADIAQATLENKLKKVETLTNQKSKADERKKTLEKISPQPPKPLKHEAEIKKLRKELLPLLKLEESCKGRLLTLKETTTLSRKEEILTEIQKLEESSRGWFEEDEAFAARVQASRKATVPKATNSASSNKKQTNTTIGRPTTSSWSTAPIKKKSTASAVRPTSSSKSSSGGIFAAMMADSSDSE